MRPPARRLRLRVGRGEELFRLEVLQYLSQSASARLMFKVQSSMLLPRLLILFVLSLALSACGGQASPAPAINASAATSSVPVAETVAVADAAPVAQTAPAPVEPASPVTPATPRQRPGEIPGLTLGQDYAIIDNGQRFTQDADVEVAEVFSYWCGGCANFQPLIDGWKPRLPAGVKFVYVPMVNDPRDSYPRAFFAAQASGLIDQAHAAIYRAIHVDRRLRANANMDEISAFLAAYGVSAQEIKSTMESFAVNANLGRARQFSIRNGVSHTPMLIIDGKYRVNGRSQEDQLRIAGRIIAHLRGGTP